MFVVQGAYHEIFMEVASLRNSAINVMTKFFSQDSDDVNDVQPEGPLKLYDESLPIFTLPEIMIRSTGAIVAIVGVAIGVAMMVSGRWPL